MRHFTDAALEPLLWWVGEWSLRWAALIALLALALAVCQPRRAATRHLLCLAVLLAGLVLPAAPRWGPGWRARVTAPPEAAALTAPPAVAHPPAAPPVADRSPTAEPMPASDDLPPAPEPLGARRLAVLALSGLWTCGALLLLARWAGGCVYLARLRRSAVVPSGPATELFDCCSTEMGLSRRVRLACHSAVASPVALGFLRPLVLVPPGWANLPEESQRAGLLHELAHLRRQDQRLVPLLELLRAALFFHLPLHWLLGRLERERELLCDEAAVVHGVAPRELARTLLRFASCPARLLPAFGRRRTVLTRIRHLLEDDMERSTSPLPFRRAAVAGALVVGLALGLASLRLRAGAPTPDEAPAASDDKRDQPPQAARFPKEALRYGGKSFEQWRTELLTELKPAVRADGMKALSSFGVNGYGAEAAAAILELMRGYDLSTQDRDDTSVINAACEAIDKIGEPTLPALRAGLKDRGRNVREFAAATLSRNSLWAKGAVPELFAALRDRDPYVRCDAVNALGAVKPRPKEYLPALRRSIKDTDDRVRNATIDQLGRIGPPAREAVPALLDVLDNDKPPQRRSAVQALVRIKTEAKTILPALIRAVQEPSRGADLEAANALGALGPAASEAVPALIAALKRWVKEGNAVQMSAIIQALGQIGPSAREAVPLLKDGQRFWARWGLGDIATAALEKIEK